MIKCDVRVNYGSERKRPRAVKEKVCHLVYFPLVCCLFQPIGRDDNKKILRHPLPHSGLPLQPNKGPQGPQNNIFAVRESSRSFRLCVNDGSLVIPSHLFRFFTSLVHTGTNLPCIPFFSLTVLMMSHLPELMLAAAADTLTHNWP